MLVAPPRTLPAISGVAGVAEELDVVGVAREVPDDLHLGAGGRQVDEVVVRVEVGQAGAEADQGVVVAPGDAAAVAGEEVARDVGDAAGRSSR